MGTVPATVIVIPNAQRDREEFASAADMDALEQSYATG
jgi:hypothetical protein